MEISSVGRVKPVFVFAIGIALSAAGAYVCYQRHVAFRGHHGGAWQLNGAAAVHYGLIEVAFGALCCLLPFTALRPFARWTLIIVASGYGAYRIVHGHGRIGW